MFRPRWIAQHGVRVIRSSIRSFAEGAPKSRTSTISESELSSSLPPRLHADQSGRRGVGYLLLGFGTLVGGTAGYAFYKLQTDPEYIHQLEEEHPALFNRLNSWLGFNPSPKQPFSSTSYPAPSSSVPILPPAEDDFTSSSSQLEYDEEPLPTNDVTSSFESASFLHSSESRDDFAHVNEMESLADDMNVDHTPNEELVEENEEVKNKDDEELSADDNVNEIVEVPDATGPSESTETLNPIVLTPESASDGSEVVSDEYQTPSQTQVIEEPADLPKVVENRETESVSVEPATPSSVLSLEPSTSDSSSVIPSSPSPSSNSTVSEGSFVEEVSSSPSNSGILSNDLEQQIRIAEDRVRSLIEDVREASKEGGHVLQDALSKQRERDQETFAALIHTQEEIHKQRIEKLKVDTEAEIRLVLAREREMQETMRKEALEKQEKELEEQYLALMEEKIRETEQRMLKARQEALADRETSLLNSFNNERDRRMNAIDEILGQLEGLEDMIRRHSEYQQMSHRIHCLESAAFVVQRSLFTRKPFSVELDALASVAQDDSLVSDAIAAIRSTGADVRGVPTVGELQERFKVVFVEGRRASFLPPQAGIFGHLYARMLAAITFAPKGMVPGHSAEAKLARAEAYLQRGDLLGAMGELESVQGASKEIVKDFLSELKSRIVLETAMDTIRSQSTLLAYSLS